MTNHRKRYSPLRLARGSGSLIYIKSRKRWAIVGYEVQPDGSVRRPTEYLPPEIATRQQAETFLQRRLAKDLVQARGHRRNFAQTVAALVDAFVLEAPAQYRRARGLAQHWGSDKATAEQWKRMQGKIRLSEYGGCDLRTFRDALDALNAYTRYGVNRKIDAVRRVVRWGVSHDLCPPDLLATLKAVEPLRTGQALSRDGGPRSAPPHEHFYAALDKLPARWRWVALLQRWTGARPTEILCLRVKDLDRSGDIWIARPQFHKTEHHGVARDLYLPPHLYADLACFLDALTPEDYLFSPRRWAREAHQDAVGRRPNQKPNARKSTRTLGDFPDHSAYRKAIKKACEDAGVAVFTPYQLCNLRLTEIELALSREHASAARNHSDLQVTATYTRLAQEKRRAALSKEAAMVGEVIPKKKNVP